MLPVCKEEADFAGGNGLGLVVILPLLGPKPQWKNYTLAVISYHYFSHPSLSGYRILKIGIVKMGHLGQHG